MKILIFGATGMVGQGVLRECLRAGDVTQVLVVGRNPTGVQHPKLRELLTSDLYDYRDQESQLQGFDACFFCLGVSSAGMAETEYHHMTYDLTMAAAKTLARLNPQMCFAYVSGAGTDSSEHGRVMWARVKGKLENALMQLPFKAAYLFRPGVIQPLHGARSKTTAYRVIYTMLKPLLSTLRLLWPDVITTTEAIGLAMLALVRNHAPSAVLETRDIQRASQPA